MNRAALYLILVVMIGGMLTGLYQCGASAGRRATELAYAPKMEELRLCKAGRTQLQGEIARQNGKIDELKKESDAAKKRADELVTQANVTARAHTAKAQSLMMAQPKSADRCEAATILLRENL